MTEMTWWFGPGEQTGLTVNLLFLSGCWISMET